MQFHYSSISTISYERFGNGDNIAIFLHGFGASSFTWLYITQYLRDNSFTSYLVDLKGHGFSSFNIDDDYSIFDQSKMILAFIDHIEALNVTIVGHSYGGGIALTAAIESQRTGLQKIKRLIVIDPAAFKDKIPFFISVMQNPIQRWFSSFFFSPLQRAKFVLRSLYFDKSLLTDEMIGYYAKFYTGKQWNTIIKMANHIIPENYNEIIEAYPTLRIPVNIIWGANDPIFPKGLGQKLNKLLMNSQLEIIPEVGHIPHEEKPITTFELFSKFIKS